MKIRTPNASFPRSDSHSSVLPNHHSMSRIDSVRPSVAEKSSPEDTIHLLHPAARSFDHDHAHGNIFEVGPPQNPNQCPHIFEIVLIKMIRSW